MAIQSLVFPAPLRRSQVFAPRDHARRDRAIELFEDGQPLQALHETLGYLLGSPKPEDMSGTGMCLVQGTARVRLRLVDGNIEVDGLLARLPSGAPSTAALRFILTHLSATGQLYQPRLHGDEVRLRYVERLDLLHPLKLIEVLQRLPGEVDLNDQWMVDAFGVETPDREPLQPLSEAELDQAHRIWSEHWTSLDGLQQESRRRRSVRVLNAVCDIAALLPRYTLPLAGTLRQQLQDHANEFTDRDQPPNKRDAALARCIKELQQVTREQLGASLGHASYAFNPMHEGTPALLSSMLGGGQRMQTVSELRAAGRSMEAALMLAADFLDLVAYQTWPDEIAVALRAALDAASGAPWREATDALWSHAHAIAKRYGSHGDTATDESSAAYGD